MITKISKPFKSGKIVYDNKGSVARLVNYLAHEAKPQRKEVIYFNQHRNDITAQEVVTGIDRNQKGLRPVDAKFYSLVISPSAEELKHIGNDAEKLKNYTRQVMENYARNFTLKEGKKLNSVDLVWYATFHQGREYNGLDKAVQEGVTKAGAAKPGLQTHIHVVVSRRDANQQFSLTPTGRKERFSIQDWQKQNAGDFQQMFSYEKQTYFDKAAVKEGHLRQRLDKLRNAKGLPSSYLNSDRVVSLAKEQEFSWKFYRNLRGLEYNLKQGIRPSNPYEQLADQKPKALGVNRSAGQEATSSRNTAAKAAGTKQSLSASEEKVQKSNSQTVGKAAKQPLRPEMSRQTNQLAQFFSTLSRTATIAGHEEDWGDQIKKQKPRKRQRQRDEGLSL